MLFKILLNFIYGYKQVEIEGYYLERFLNEILKNSIFVWKIDRIQINKVRINASNSAIIDLKEIALKNQCLMKITKDCGIPAIVKRYKKRRYIFGLSFTFFIMIFAISRFIWNIDVSGNIEIDKKQVIEIAKKSGLSIGKYKQKIDTESVIKDIKNSLDNVSWVGVDYKGTNAIIKIVEGQKIPMVVNENDFCNIVAKKDGEIQKIVAQNGTVMCKDGDNVKQGQILIAGWMEGLYTGKYFVNSEGSVKAKISYSETTKIYKNEIERKHTGKRDKKVSIKMKNLQINLFKRVSKFKKYDTIETIKSLRLSSNFYLPIKFVIYDSFEVEEIKKYNDFETAKTNGELTAKSKLDKKIKGELINSDTKITEYNDYYSVTVYYDVIEEIGTKEKI